MPSKNVSNRTNHPAPPAPNATSELPEVTFIPHSDPAIAAAAADPDSVGDATEDQTLYHLPIYLDADTVLDAENVRPGETPDQHEDRVSLLASQIESGHQELPIKVAEVPLHIGAQNETAYQVVDGQGRLDAIRKINRKRKSDGLDPLLVWCVLSRGNDSWATAVKLNVQRRNYTDLQLADLIQQARKRYGWDKSKGGGKKTAEFFGIKEQLLVEYNTLAAAPADVKARLESGELSKSSVLSLLRVEPGTEVPAVQKRDKIASKAREIAAKDAPATRSTPAAASSTVKEARAAGKLDATPKVTGKFPVPKIIDKMLETLASAPLPKAPKVQARHIAQAAREVAIAAHEPAPIIKRNRTEILASISQLLESSPDTKRSAEGRAFLEQLGKFADGTCSPRQLQNKWNPLVGISK